MTLQDLITSIEANLGDRATGVIGNQPVASVILKSVNFALPQCVKLANPEFYDETIEMQLTTAGGTEYVIPEVDGKLVKDITHVRTSRVDGTPVSINKVTFAQFIQVTRDYDQQIQGVPSSLAYREGKVLINRIPSEEYNLTLFAEVWPKNLTDLDLEVQLPIDNDWSLAVEAYATYYCYLKLQQVTMSDYWKDTYEEQKSINVQTNRKKDIRGQGTGKMTVSGNVFLQPFVQSVTTIQ